MATENFVFFQIGDQPEPAIFVKSIRRLMPQARIIQCSDSKTRKIDGVTDKFLVEGDTSKLMTYRLHAFNSLKLNEPAIYMDSDMLLLRPIQSSRLLDDADAVVCERSFRKDFPFNINFRGEDWSVYQGKSLNQAHPYIACFTVTPDHSFWGYAHELLQKMPSKFHYWFGDQEAIKEIVNNGGFKIKKVPESQYACLPEKMSDLTTKPRVLHFKGMRRKEWMSDYFRV